MKVIRETRTIELTRRNLLALLVKLDGNPPNSACTIGEPLDGTNLETAWRVRAVEDIEHYRDRPAGRMIKETEDALAGAPDHIHRIGDVKVEHTVVVDGAWNAAVQAAAIAEKKAAELAVLRNLNWNLD